MNTFKPDETMLHNYLQNKLSPSDEEQLELWLADHPELLEDLELDLVMKEGLEKKKLTSDDNSINYLSNHTSSFNLLSLPSFIAGMFVALLTSFFYLNYKQSDNNPMSLVQEFTISQTRSVEDVIEITVDSNEVLLRINLKDEWTQSYEKFKVVLSSRNVEISSALLTPNWNNSLMMLFDVEYLANKQSYIDVLVYRDENWISLKGHYIKFNKLDN